MSMQIMVAVDAGSQNVATMELAARWAQRFGGSVTGFGVIDENAWAPAPVLAPGDAGLQPPDNAARSRAKKRVEDGLARLEECCRKAKVDYRQSTTEGTPQDEILAGAQGHDLILFGKQSPEDPGVGVSSRKILENVLRHSPRPVVAVPERIDPGEGVLVAYDGSLQAARALQAFFACGLALLGNVAVLSVDEKSEETARRQAAAALQYLAGHRIEADCHAEKTDRPVHRAILDEANRRRVELIVMGAYGRSRLSECFLGSVTTGIVDESRVPVLLYH